jgi:hypothetical protein
MLPTGADLGDVPLRGESVVSVGSLTSVAAVGLLDAAIVSNS